MSRVKVRSPLTGIDYNKTIFDPHWFFANMLYIVDKNNKLKLFELNNEQRRMLDDIKFCLDNGIPIRMIVLKARQIGSTTFFVGLGFWLAAMHKNVTYGIVAHRMDSAQSIFDKCKVMYNNLPPELRPSTTQLSSEGITFDKKNGKGINSRIKFATVSDGVFRGQTLTYLHQSECAFYEGNIDAINNSLAPTVADNPGTIIVKESTANGYNHFKSEWDRAVRGDSGYKAYFFGWQDHDEYQKDYPKGFEDTLTEKEKQLQERFNLTLKQLMWRRKTIEDDYGGNEVQFGQEYPMTPEEAFIASGGGVIPAETIKLGYEGSIPPIAEIPVKSYPTFEKIKIWEFPQVITEKVYAKKSVWSDEDQEYKYVDTDLVVEENTYMTPYTIGIDTAGMGADKNQIVVVDNITKRLVARYEKKNIGEEALAEIAVEMAKMYHNALIAPEVNYSHEICNFILKLGYKNLYITESVARQDQKISGSIEYGWKTTQKTKAPLISSMRARLVDDPSLIKDRDFWYEAEYFLLEDVAKNIMNAASGHHDDILMATAIAMYVSDSFQAKQSRTIIKNKTDVADSFFVNFAKKAKKKKKRTPIRKGIYNNNA